MPRRTLYLTALATALVSVSTGCHAHQWGCLNSCDPCAPCCPQLGGGPRPFQGLFNCFHHGPVGVPAAAPIMAGPPPGCATCSASPAASMGYGAPYGAPPMTSAPIGYPTAVPTAPVPGSVFTAPPTQVTPPTISRDGKN